MSRKMSILDIEELRRLREDNHKVVDMTPKDEYYLIKSERRSNTAAFPNEEAVGPGIPRIHQHSYFGGRI